MKKLFSGNFGVFLLAIILAVTFTSCEKTVTKQDKQDVVFTFDNKLLDQSIGKKAGHDDAIPECSDKEASYVKIYLNGEWVQLDLVNIEDGTQTQVLQLDPASYIIGEFLVYAADGTLIYASPHEGSYYDNLFNFNNNVEVKFNLEKWHKSKINVDVLCYNDAEYDSFGFVWFDYHMFEVNTTCFYGDVCTKFWEEWGAYGNADTNPYWGWTGGYDTYAVYEVIITDEAGNVTSGTNFPFDPKDPKPVCVEWLDDMEIAGESYTFELYLYTPEGDKELVYTGTFTDEEPLGSDAYGDIFNFVVGGSDCNAEGNVVDLNVALPWIPVPDEISFKLFQNTESYFGAKLTSVSAAVNTEFVVGHEFNAWCGNKDLTIQYGHEYKANVYAWYDALSIPGYNMTQSQVDALNYIANNQSALKTTYGVDEIQKYIWDLLGYTSGTSTMTLPSVSGYIPPVGGYGVVFIDPYFDLTTGKKCTPEKHYQMLIVRIDP